ncbi:lipopolysaccharide-induced tumor necrosis factor-alpha factor homolog [Pollicipes pollicipes]|nr:lipopolysaccharide-induced tumor necrosis factor-alpha factor homolog isoform X2 [Pollicipes pollicipes]XP_037088158.1 lipopolysaccharide-induced tumor necrosis factor-alpha factor homolog isoform X2 [Pollicipes pollicipes]XP_037090962.1 lipopolysaccharide-induced tumor necrosis factor-alpha factor homolog [Pollicipes pollicipes]XP_037090969.1 lipopolysaccharide-induced tumor necrosis factor-alpha factor homolog [Pollicipes pollicipes]
MSKASAPPDFQPPTDGPPSYNQAMTEGAAYQPTPGPADYKAPPMPQVASPYGPPGGAGPSPYGQGPGVPYGQGPGVPYGQGPGGPYGQGPGGPYGQGPGVPHGPAQQQQYGQYGAPPGVPLQAAPPAQTHLVTVAGPNPAHMMCPHCHAEIETSVRSSPSTTAWIAGLLIALFGCWMGCCLIPCCMDECMNKEHFCPNCKAFLGSYRR